MYLLLYLTENTMQSNREYAIYNLILIVVSPWLQNYTNLLSGLTFSKLRTIYSHFNQQNDIHVYGQKNINRSKEDSSRGLYPYLWHNHSVNINLPWYTTWYINLLKVILCASEHICSIVRYCFRSFTQLQKDP